MCAHVSRNVLHDSHIAFINAAIVQAISLWDVDGGMPQIDKYTYSEDPNIVAGSCLGFGLCCCCVRSELDPAFALLSEHVHSTSAQVRVAAVMALGLAYAGTAKEDVRELLLPLISPEEASVELVAHAALALGIVFAGTKDGAPPSDLYRSLLCRVKQWWFDIFRGLKQVHAPF